MRVKQRIPIMMELFKSQEMKQKFLDYLFKPEKSVQLDLFEKHPFLLIENMIDNWNKNEVEIENFWKENPDLRLTQVLVIKNIIPNSPGMWYHTEESSYVIQNGLKEPREILFWGQNYDKDMNLLPETRFILIKDMAKDHIEAILRDCDEGRYDINEYYLEVFKNELKLRENGRNTKV
jgi:hypothetical protein